MPTNHSKKNTGTLCGGMGWILMRSICWGELGRCYAASLIYCRFVRGLPRLCRGRPRLLLPGATRLLYLGYRSPALRAFVFRLSSSGARRLCCHRLINGELETRRPSVWCDRGSAKTVSMVQQGFHKGPSGPRKSSRGRSPRKWGINKE